MRLVRRRLDVSFVVIAYNMERELPRTLQSLSRAYQIGTSGISYEVLVVDNGSHPPFGKERVEAYGQDFRYFYLDNASVSPAHALNFGARQARGDILCLMIDGARIASPGILRWAKAAFAAFADPTVAVLGWHLGPDLQNRSVAGGYDQTQEDALLHSVGFPADGYRLFEISVFAGSCIHGWFMPSGESNALFLRQESYWSMGGYDEQFDLEGGGLLNLDLFRRAVLREGTELVVLLGEGMFHQVHGGIATNAGEALLKTNIELWRAQYKRIRGEDFSPPRKRPVYLGTVPTTALNSLAESARTAAADPCAWD